MEAAQISDNGPEKSFLNEPQYSEVIAAVFIKMSAVPVSIALQVVQPTI